MKIENTKILETNDIILYQGINLDNDAFCFIKYNKNEHIMSVSNVYPGECPEEKVLDIVEDSFLNMNSLEERWIKMDSVVKIWLSDFLEEVDENKQWELACEFIKKEK